MYYVWFEPTGIESNPAAALGTRTHTGGTTDFGQGGIFFGLDSSTKAEIANHNVCILLGVPKQQVFWFEVAVDDTTAVEVFDSAEDGPDKICSIPGTEEGKITHDA